MTFQYIGPGEYWMGSPAEEIGRDNDERKHKVKLTKGFWIAETKVTQRQFAVFIERTGYVTDAERRGNSSVWTGEVWDEGKGINWRNSGGLDFPVVHVSWNDAQAFSTWLSGNVNLGVVKLPTEAQWEYAARAGSDSASYVGGLTVIDDCNVPELNSIAWHCGNSGQKNHPVKQKLPNAFGLYDMLGSVWEWSADWYQSQYDLKNTVDPSGPASGTQRSVRSGSFALGIGAHRAANRGKWSPSGHDNTLGFRVVIVDP